MNYLVCNKVGHEQQSIIALCTHNGCQDVRTCCGKCIMASHTTHIGSVIQLEDLQKTHPNPLLQFVDDLRKKVNLMLNEIEKAISSNFIPIFPQEVNLTNMNNFAGQLAQGGTIDTSKIKELLLQSNKAVMQILEKCLNSIKLEGDLELRERKEEALRLKNRGIDFCSQGRYQQVIIFYDRSLDIYDKDDDCWNNKGSALRRFNKFEEAIKCYEQAILINSNNSMYYYNKALSLFNLKKLQEALECIQKGLDLNPNYAGSWTVKGLILASMSEKEKALKCYQKAVEITPDRINYYNLALALEQLDRKDEALKCYQEVVKLYPNDQEAIAKIKAIKESK